MKGRVPGSRARLRLLGRRGVPEGPRRAPKRRWRRQGAPRRPSDASGAGTRAGCPAGCASRTGLPSRYVPGPGNHGAAWARATVALEGGPVVTRAPASSWAGREAATVAATLAGAVGMRPLIGSGSTRARRSRRTTWRASGARTRVGDPDRPDYGRGGAGRQGRRRAPRPARVRAAPARSRRRAGAGAALGPGRRGGPIRFIERCSSCRTGARRSASSRGSGSWSGRCSAG